MSALSIQVPFPVFQDRDGQPLDNGYVWLGTSSLNPQTNPVVAYYDSALTIVATQPLRTLNGFISRAGSPAQVYVDAVNFSILVQDRQGTTVFSVPEGTGISPNASGVVYDPAGTGAVATTQQAVNRRVIHLLDFKNAAAIAGDWTTGFQAAIDYAQLTYARLELFAGEINITDELIISQTNGLSIRGAGQHATIIRISTAGKCGFKGGSAVSPGPVADRNKVTFEDFTLVGSAAGNPYTASGTYGTTSHGIEMTNWHHYELHRVGVWFFGGDGLHLIESYIGTTNHCHIAGNAGWGVYAGVSTSGVGYSNHATTITNSEVQGNKTGGIYVDGSSSFNILNNTIESNTSVGVDIIFASGFTITGNYFETNGAYSIRVGNTLSAAGPVVGGAIKGNHLENALAGPVTAGVLLNYAYGVEVSGNFGFRTTALVSLTSNAFNCVVGPNHSIDPVLNASTDSMTIADGMITSPSILTTTWTPVATSLTGTGVAYNARYFRYGSNMTCFITITGTGLESTSDTTSLTLPIASGRISIGVCAGGGSVTTGAFCLVSGSSVILPTIAATSRIDMTFSYSLV